MNMDEDAGLYASMALDRRRLSLAGRRWLRRPGAGPPDGTESLLADKSTGKRAQARGPSSTAGLHHRARARRVVQLFMSGAASQCDTFDYKPALIKKNGQKFDPGGKVELFQSEPGAVMASPWKWRQYGQCGQWVSDLVPHLAAASTTWRSCRRWSRSRTCTGRRPSCRTPGFVLPGFPSMGAWISYGLGSLSQNLPTFVVLPDSRGFAPNGPANWTAGFLPAAHQGTMVRPGAKNPIFDLFPPEEAELDSPRPRATGSSS